MANNRIFLKCKVCGDTLFLGKRFMDKYYFNNYGGEELEKRLNDFYDKHYECSFDSDYGLDNFELEYEDIPEWQTERKEEQ